MRARAILLAAALLLAPLTAAADLVVWWQLGQVNPGEDEVVRELVAAFERKTGKHVEVAFTAQNDLSAKTLAALAAGTPPDFLFGLAVDAYFGQWAHDGRLVDLADALGPLAAQFDPDALERATLLDATTGRRALYALPMASSTLHVHVWKSLLQRAGLTLADIPKQWEPFWSFWCDTVQPAVRKATGRDDLYGLGLAMGTKGDDTNTEFEEFVQAYGADYVTRDGRLVIDQPRVQAALVRALDAYTAPYRKGCVPPDAADWDNPGNNQAFLGQRVVMTPNATLSIPNALRATRPEDYYKNATTLGWPGGAAGRPLALVTQPSRALVFRAGGHEPAAKEFVHLLVGDGWLAHWLDFAGHRFLPPMPALVEQPFWLDPGDPHKMTSAIQFLTQPRTYSYAAASGEWRHQLVKAEAVWRKAVHRVVADGLTPERAVD